MTERTELRPGESMLSTEAELYLKKRCDELGRALIKANKRAQLFQMAYERLSKIIGVSAQAVAMCTDELMQLCEPKNGSASPAAAHPSNGSEDPRYEHRAPDTLRSAQLPPISSSDREQGVTLCPSTERALSRSALPADATKLS